jgi:hypothetical protein
MFGEYFVGKVFVRNKQLSDVTGFFLHHQQHTGKIIYQMLQKQRQLIQLNAVWLLRNPVREFAE